MKRPHFKSGSHQSVFIAASGQAPRVSLKAGRPGYTLAELILVLTLIVMLASVAIGSLLRTNSTFQFNAAVQAVNSIVREARSYAVTGKAQIDYTDYDGDGCKGGTSYPGYEHLGGCTLALDIPDYVTPANYGIYFDSGNNRLIAFADMHGSTEGVYDAPAASGLMVYEDGKDMHIAEYTMPSIYKFYLYANPAPVPNTVMFSPIFADVSFSPAMSASAYFFVFGVEEATGERESCMAIQRVAGIPEDAARAGQPCGT